MNGQLHHKVGVRAPAFYGEFLVDVLFEPHQQATYHPGGAPANAAASAAALGVEPFLIASVGADRLGEWLAACASAEGINTQALKVVEGCSTSLAIAYPNGRTSEKFTFYRDADLRIYDEQVRAIDANSIGVLVYGSISLCRSPFMTSSLSIIKRMVRDSGGLLMCDINYRQSLWRSAEEFSRAIRREVSGVDIVKANLVEASLASGESDSPSRLASKILGLGPSLAIVTAGAEGLVACTRDISVDIRALRRVPGEGLVGTGDAVAGTLASVISRDGLSAVATTTNELSAVLREAMNKAEAAASKRGADWRNVVAF